MILELGGSDPFIVLQDADIERAVSSALTSRFRNAGQMCNAAKRIIILREIADLFMEQFVEKTKNMKVGDPMNTDMDMGPLVRETQRNEIEEQINMAVQNGAHILTGGKRINGKGFYFEPTVMNNVTESMNVCREEVFGPVAPIIIVNTEEDAIKVANNTPFGLGASIWTKDLEKGKQISKKINAGNTYVNKAVRSDPRLPFGGIKKSGTVSLIL